MGEISRRDALRALGGLGAAAALAACTKRSTGTPEPPLSPLPAKAGRLSIATWPGYIDVNEATGRRPSIDAFTAQTQIVVDYREILEDAAAFAEQVRAWVESGEPPPYDIAVVPSWLVGRMARAGHLERLHHDALKNVDASIGPLFDGPSYDPGNRYSVAWQGGITALGYDPNLTGRAVDSLTDLFHPDFAGRVGLSSEMLDTMSLMLLHLGIDPERATVADAGKARDLLVKERRKIRAFYGSDAAEALARGELALAMTWSTDILHLQADNPELLFVVPREGAVVWSDDMVILRGAPHLADAHAWIDHYYRPKVAAQVAERITYVTPVPGARPAMLARAAEVKDADERAELERIANSALVFPTAEMQTRLHRYPVLSEDEDRAWNAAFQEAVDA